MTTLSVTLADEQAKKLEEMARQAGITPEELLRAGIEAWLSRPAGEFSQAADYVLGKNAELYRRLA